MISPVNPPGTHCRSIAISDLRILRKLARQSRVSGSSSMGLQAAKVPSQSGGNARHNGCSTAQINACPVQWLNTVGPGPKCRILRRDDPGSGVHLYNGAVIDSQPGSVPITRLLGSPVAPSGRLAIPPSCPLLAGLTGIVGRAAAKRVQYGHPLRATAKPCPGNAPFSH